MPASGLESKLIRLVFCSLRSKLSLHPDFVDVEPPTFISRSLYFGGLPLSLRFDPIALHSFVHDPEIVR